MLQKLLGIKIPDTVYFYHVDIRDFYMIGPHDHLSTNSSQIISSAGIREMIKDATAFILDHQYVSGIQGKLPMNVILEVVKLIEGSGQGLSHSAAIASAAFLHSNELNGPGFATRAYRSKANLALYVRYADNMLFVCNDYSSVKIIEHDFSNLEFYTTKSEEESSSGVSILDVRVEVVSNQLVYRPILKEKGVYLSPTSAHPFSISRNWPIQYLSRLASLSSSAKVYKDACKLFTTMLKKAGFDQWIIQEVVDCSNYSFPRPSVSRNRRNTPPQRKFFVVLQYHPLWHKACPASICRNVMLSAAWRKLEDILGPCSLNVAWSAACSTFGSTLAKL